MLRDETLDIRLYAENLLKDEERDVVELSEVMKVVEAVQSSPLWQRAKAADERYVEIPFALEVPSKELALPPGPPEALLHGTIDVVFREGEEWSVIDYKTDSTTNRIEQLTEYYAPQVRLYADSWSRLTGGREGGGREGGGRVRGGGQVTHKCAQLISESRSNRASIEVGQKREFVAQIVS